MIVYGERALTRQRRPRAAERRLAAEPRRDRRRRPARAARRRPNGRGVREAGFAPGHGPGYATLAAPGRDAAGDRRGPGERRPAQRSGCTTSTRCATTRTAPLWERALGTAQTVIAVESQMTDTMREFADVVFPAEAYPEKEGTLTHPDGRLQRLRPGDRPPARRRRPAGLRRAAAVAGHRRRRARRSATIPATFRTGAQVSRRLFEAVPFYDGHHARGDRRPRRALGRARGVRLARLGAGQARDPAGGAPAASGRQAAARHLPPAVGGQGGRPLARAAVHPRPPGRRALARRRRRARASARATGSRSATARACARRCELRDAVPAGSVFLAEGTREDNANVLDARRWSRSTGSVRAPSSRAPSPRRSSPPSRAWPRCRRPPPLPIPPREVT